MYVSVPRFLNPPPLNNIIREKPTTYLHLENMWAKLKLLQCFFFFLSQSTYYCSLMPSNAQFTNPNICQHVNPNGMCGIITVTNHCQLRSHSRHFDFCFSAQLCLHELFLEQRQCFMYNILYQDVNSMWSETQRWWQGSKQGRWQWWGEITLSYVQFKWRSVGLYMTTLCIVCVCVFDGFLIAMVAWLNNGGNISRIEHD